MRSGVCALALLLGSVATQAQQLSVHGTEPRAFGYYVGDRIERELTIEVPPGLKLDEASLPRPGQRGAALELQQLQRETTADGLRLRFVYQLFKSPPQTETLEIAPIVLRFSGQPRAQDLRIDAWPVTVSPLVPAEAPSRQGLGPLRPDQAPLLADTRPPQQRLLVEGIAALLLLAYLAHVYLLTPWWARRGRPFGQAWQRLRGDAHGDFQLVHEALNRTAGEVLFAQGVDRFVAAQPRYRPLQAELAEFFRRSRQAFFAAGPGQDDGPWLRQFCRKCRDAERGAA